MQRKEIFYGVERVALREVCKLEVPSTSQAFGGRSRSIRQGSEWRVTCVKGEELWWP